MSIATTFKTLSKQPVVAALSMVAVFAPLAANGNEKQAMTVSTVASQVEQPKKKVSPIELLDSDKLESDVDKEFKLIRAEDFIREQSDQTPVIFIVAGGKKEFLHAAHYAEKIQQSLTNFGYDVKVWAMKSDRPNISSMSLTYKDKTFEGTIDLGNKTPRDAYDKRMAFASFCQFIDRDIRLGKTVEPKKPTIVAASPALR